MKFTEAQRVMWHSNGPWFGRLGTVVRVRENGHLLVEWDGDPVGTMSFTRFTDVREAP